MRTRRSGVKLGPWVCYDEGMIPLPRPKLQVRQLFTASTHPTERTQPTERCTEATWEISRRGVKKVPKDHASRLRGGRGSALLNVASLAPRVRLAFADD